MLQRRLDRGQDSATLQPVTTAAELIAMRASLEQVEVSPDILEYVVAIIQATRSHAQIQVGASPRGGLALVQLARAQAVLEQRDFVIPDDVKRVGVPPSPTGSRCDPSCGCARSDRMTWWAACSTAFLCRGSIRRPPLTERSSQATVGTSAASPQGLRRVPVCWSLSAHARRLVTLTLAGLIIAIVSGRPEFAGLSAPALLMLATWRSERAPELTVRVILEQATAVEGDTVIVTIELQGHDDYGATLAVAPGDFIVAGADVAVPSRPVTAGRAPRAGTSPVGHPLPRPARDHSH